MVEGWSVPGGPFFGSPISCFKGRVSNSFLLSRYDHLKLSLFQNRFFPVLDCHKHGHTSCGKKFVLHIRPSRCSPGFNLRSWRRYLRRWFSFSQPSFAKLNTFLYNEYQKTEVEVFSNHTFLPLSYQIYCHRRLGSKKRNETRFLRITTAVFLFRLLLINILWYTVCTKSVNESYIHSKIRQHHIFWSDGAILK